MATDGGWIALLCIDSRLHGFFHLLSCGYTTLGRENGQGEKAEASARLDSQNVEHDNYHDFVNHNCPLSSIRCCESNQIIRRRPLWEVIPFTCKLLLWMVTVMMVVVVMPAMASIQDLLI